jgi:hypothetical protein
MSKHRPKSDRPKPGDTEFTKLIFTNNRSQAVQANVSLNNAAGFGAAYDVMVPPTPTGGQPSTWSPPSTCTNIVAVQVVVSGPAPNSRLGLCAASTPDRSPDPRAIASSAAFMLDDHQAIGANNANLALLDAQGAAVASGDAEIENLPVPFTKLTFQNNRSQAVNVLITAIELSNSRCVGSAEGVDIPAGANSTWIAPSGWNDIRTVTLAIRGPGPQNDPLGEISAETPWSFPSIRKVSSSAAFTLNEHVIGQNDARLTLLDAADQPIDGAVGNAEIS